MIDHLTVRSYAKINLGLHILDKRDDGYHDLETVFYPVDIFDEIELRPYHDSVVISCTHPHVPVNSTNLCARAANSMRAYLKSPDGIHITIHKNIPVGGGLGGGSSDAAAVLLALRELWQADISDEDLSELASGIGADVRYFLRPTAAFATGRGDNLEYFDYTLPYWTVVVFPYIQISTAWAYENFQLRMVRRDNLRNLIERHPYDLGLWQAEMQNDFEELVFTEYPEIADIKDTLLRGGAGFALLSGSGSSVFGLFESQIDAEDTADALLSDYHVFLSPPNFSPDFDGSGRDSEF
jgi:4-diphosphocytidyl-2-C-methyl-D-erythritol kinase